MSLNALLEETRQMPLVHTEYEEPDQEIVRYRQALPAAASHHFDMRAATVSEMFGGRIPAPLTSETQTIERGLLYLAKTVQAGARIIIDPPHAAPKAEGGLLMMEKQPKSYSTTMPLEWSDIADGGSVSASSVDTSRVTIDRDDTQLCAVSVNIPRAKASHGAGVTDADVMQEAMYAIASGLPRVIDSHILAAINATTPSAFTLAKAADKGLRFDDLRALAGTSVSSNLAVDSMGSLRLHGVQADLTDQMTGGLIGHWQKVAIFIEPELRLIMKRMDANGTVKLVAMINLQVLLPTNSQGFFWSN